MVAAVEIEVQRLKAALETQYAELRQEFVEQVNRINANITALDGKTNDIANNVTRESETFATKVSQTVTSLDQSRARMDEQLNIMANRAEAFRNDATEIQSKVDAEFQKLARVQQENAVHQQQTQEAMRQSTEAMFNDIQQKCQTSIEDQYKRIQEFANTVDRSVTQLSQRIGSMGSGPAPAPTGGGTQGQSNQGGFDTYPGAGGGRVPTFRMDGDGAQPERRGQIRGLIHHSELKVERLAEEIKRDQFILWRDQLEESLEQTPGFSGATDVLEQVRRCKVSISETHVVEMEAFSGSDFESANIVQVREMSRQLFGVLKLKMNTKTNSLCKDIEKDIGRNGFELYRRISHEYDPLSDGTPHLMYGNLMSIGQRGASKTFEDTVVEYRKVRRIIEEHDKITAGNKIDMSLKMWVYWNVTDMKTRSRMEARAELSSPASRTPEKLQSFIEELYEEKRNEAVFSRIGKGDPMDVIGVAWKEEPDSQGEEERYTAAEWQEWEQHQQDAHYPPPPVPDPSWTRGDNHLDAMGKGVKGGKGKGPGKGGGKGGKGQLICRRCGGAGHPERVCGTPIGSTSTITCNVCKGRGHTMALCPSYGGGKYVPPQQRQRSAGKGGISDLAERPPEAGSQGAVVPWVPPSGTQHAQLPPATQNAANWAMNGPWMGAGARPIDSVQRQVAPDPVPGWKMKVIYSITKAQNKYKPEYNNAIDVEEEEEESPDWKVPVMKGMKKRCKNGKVSIVKATKDYSADSSFDAW